MSTQHINARPRRRVRNIVLGVVGAVFAVWLILFVTKGRFLERPFESLAGKALQRQLTVTGDFQLYFDPFDIKFVANGLTIANPAWTTRPTLFHADALDARIAPLSLLWGKRHVRWLTLTDGTVDLEWDTAHTHNSWTFGDSTKPGAPFPFPRIDRASVSGTQVRYRDPLMPLVADLRIDPIVSTDAHIGAAVGLRGDGTVRTTPFTVTARLLTPDETANRGANKLALEAHAAHNVIDVTGTLPSIADFADVPLQVRASGRNMGELMRIIGVAVPPTRAYTVRAQLVQHGVDYRFTHMTGRFGNSDLAGRFTVHAGPRTHVDADLTTQQLDIVDAAPFIGYNPDIVATQGVKAAALATGATAERILPDTPIAVAEMKAFDADVRWKVGVVQSRRVPISHIDLVLSLDHSLLKLSPLTLAMSRGNLAADIVLDARREPVHASYDIRLAATPMGRLLAGFGVAEAGTTGTIRGRIQLEGDGDTLHRSLAASRGRIAFEMPQGTLTQQNVQLSELDIGVFVQKMFQRELKEPVHLNCGLVGFTVRAGAATADPVLIDTSKNVITGQGGFNFGTEAVDLSIRAHAKTFSLFSGQSPIGLTGSFAHPGVQIVSPQLVGRAGAAVALGVVASPLAAVLAFVDPGGAKQTACGPVLAGATAAAQHTAKGGAVKGVVPEAAKAKRKKFLGIF